MAGSMEADLSFKKIMKDVEHFGSLHMTWKDKKTLESKKVTQLGGKPQKKQRLPLSVARVEMKKQKERQEKMLEHNKILGRFGGQFGGATRKKPKRKPEERVLKSTYGDFRGGVLDVKHLLHSSGNSTTNDGNNNYCKNKNKSKGLGGELGGGGDIKKKIKKKGKKGKIGGGKRKRK